MSNQAGEDQYPYAYSYSNRVVMTLDQELKEWQARAALLEQQLEIARQENFSLHCQLKEQRGLTEKTLPLPIEKKKTLRKLLNESSENVTITKKAMKCHHCGKANRKKKDCWRKTGKCLKCGSSEHRIKDCPRLLQEPTKLVSNTPTQQENQGMTKKAVENLEGDRNEPTARQA